MKTLVDQLGQYAGYHRDGRNIATHFIGIPMIVQAIAVLLARPSVDWAGLPWSLSSLLVLVSLLYYLRLDLRLGLVMAALFGAALYGAAAAATLPMGAWLSLGLGLFVVGWVFQFVGHYFEGRKPAFVDDLMGLIIGPLFVVAELGFLLGLRPALRDAVNERAGAPRSASSALAGTRRFG